jgi:hypothetical protein
MFSATAKYIDTPARHSHIIAHKKRAIVTITIEKTMAKIASPRMVRFIGGQVGAWGSWWSRRGLWQADVFEEPVGKMI